jgi:hypothetical protein
VLTSRQPDNALLFVKRGYYLEFLRYFRCHSTDCIVASWLKQKSCSEILLRNLILHWAPPVSGAVLSPHRSEANALLVNYQWQAFRNKFTMFPSAFTCTLFRTVSDFLKTSALISDREICYTNFEMESFGPWILVFTAIRKYLQEQRLQTELLKPALTLYRLLEQWYYYLWCFIKKNIT